MGQCITKLPHHCGARNALQIFEEPDGSVSGYCFSCRTFVLHPYGEPKKAADIPHKERIGKTKEEIAEEMEMVANCPTIDLVDRRLRAKELEYYGVKIGLNEEDGKTPKFHYYPYTRKGKVVGYKVRLIENKRMWALGEQGDVDLFGWEQARASGARRLIITEGELDAVAMYKIIETYTTDQYADFKPAVVSLPHGAAAAGKDIAKALPEIRKWFRDVSLCFDDDEAGKKATEDVCILIPDATVIHLPCKDANECVIKGKGKEAFKALTFNHKVAKNTRLVFGEELHESAREEAKYGELTWPWSHINKVTRGIRYGETIYIGAGVKCGKSELLNELAAHFIKVHGIKVFMAKPEEANKKTYKLLSGKMVGKVFHDPEQKFDYDAYDKAGEMLKGQVAMVNLYQHLGWETLKADIYAAHGWGAKAIFIDPLTTVTNGMNAGDANSKLQEIAQELAAIALDLQVVIFIFTHLKAHEGNITKDVRQKHYNNGKYLALGNCPHELGGDISSAQFAGSRAMMRSCNMMLGLEANKDAELPDEVRNIRSLKLLEDREFGQTGNFKLFWNKNTTHFEEL